jgi:hypothetical protein
MLPNGFLKFVVHNIADLDLLMMHNRWESRATATPLCLLLSPPTPSHCPRSFLSRAHPPQTSL